MEGKDFVNTIHGGPDIPKPPPVFKKRGEDFKWLAVILSGIIIIFIGSIWVTMAQWGPPPDPHNYHSISDYNRDKMAWENATESGNLYGRIIMEFGSLIMIIGGVAGYSTSSMDDANRRIFLIAIILGLSVIVLASVGIMESSPYLR